MSDWRESRAPRTSEGGKSQSQRTGAEGRDQRPDEPTEGSATEPEESSDVEETIIHTMVGETRKSQPWKHMQGIYCSPNLTRSLGGWGCGE
jgi:hypothetical protein